VIGIRNDKERTYLNIISRTMYFDYDAQMPTYSNDSLGYLISDHSLFPDCAYAKSEILEDVKKDMKKPHMNYCFIQRMTWLCECGRINIYESKKPDRKSVV
jgi:hypothetical protein